MTWKSGSSGGSTTIAALSVLVLLASVAGGGALIMQAVFAYDRRSMEREELQKSLRKEGERIVQALCLDPTPEADSPLDPVWNELGRAPEGVTVTLRDVSSALNPNWVQKNVLTKTDLGGFLIAGKTADELQQRREDKGFSTDVASEYGDLLKEEAVEKYFTGYGYANINVSDEFSLRKLYGIRTGDEAASEVFHTRVQQLLLQKKILKPAELKGFLGIEYDKLFPVINAEPLLNVHFADPMIVTELLSYPDLKVPHPAEVARVIAGSRDRAELTAQELRRIIGVTEDNRIYQYLGVVTWFWEITVSGQAARLDLIAARLPSEGDGGPRFLIVEERFSR